MNTPLDIIQDFGFFGVVLFFFVSGFIITHVSQRENHIAFLIKRLFRIYPPLIVSIIAIYASNQLYYQITGIPLVSAGADSLHNLVVAMTLTNYFMTPQVVINGVAWTLVIEMCFYALLFCLLPVVKRVPLLAALLGSLVCLLVTWSAKSFGASYFLFSVSVSYVPLLLIGQSTYFLWARRIKWYEFLGLIAINYYIFVHWVRTVYVPFYPPTNSYGVSIVYAYSVFVICMLLNDRIRVPKVIDFYSKMSYSLYLFHGFVGFLVLRIVTPYTGFSALGYGVAIVAAFAVGTSVTYLVYRLIERPSQHMARMVIKRIDGYIGAALATLRPRVLARSRFWP